MVEFLKAVKNNKKNIFSYLLTDVLEEPDTFIFRAEVGGTMFLCNDVLYRITRYLIRENRNLKYVKPLIFSENFY